MLPIPFQAMLMKDDSDSAIDTMLGSLEEVEVAVEISKILTAALVCQMQSKMRGKINLQLGTLNSQKLQLSAVDKALLKVQCSQTILNRIVFIFRSALKRLFFEIFENLALDYLAFISLYCGDQAEN